jgi:hypothetical protein
MLKNTFEKIKTLGNSEKLDFSRQTRFLSRSLLIVNEDLKIEVERRKSSF